MAAADDGALLAELIAKRGAIAESAARQAVERGGAFVNGKRVKLPGRALKKGDAIEVHLLEKGEAPKKPPTLSNDRLLHLDAQVMVVDKPAGVLAQEGLAGGPDLPTLATALLARKGESGPALLVHRLDRGTTGVTVLARTAAAQAKLLASFRDGKVRKEYLALCSGSPKSDAFVVDLALGPEEDPTGGRKPDPLGQPARTRVRVIRRFPGAALLTVFPETGRTHQIRVHLSEQGLPLLGDARYGGPKEITRKDGARMDFERPMLHARALSAAHPNGGRLDLEAPIPADIEAAIEFLGGGKP